MQIKKTQKSKTHFFGSRRFPRSGRREKLSQTWGGSVAGFLFQSDSWYFFFIFFMIFIDKLSSSSSPNQILVRSWGEQSHNMVLPGRRRWAWWALTTGQISVWSFLRGKCLHFGEAEALFGKHWQVLHLSIGGTPLPTLWQFLGCAQKIMKEATLANFVSVASHCAKNIKLDHCIYILPKLSYICCFVASWWWRFLFRWKMTGLTKMSMCCMSSAETGNKVDVITLSSFTQTKSEIVLFFFWIKYHFALGVIHICLTVNLLLLNWWIFQLC